MRATWVLVLLASCGGPSPASGVLTNGLDGAPLADVGLIAQAVGEAELPCRAFEARTGPDGAFTFDRLCAGVRYRVRDVARTWSVAGGDDVRAGASGVALTTWWAPEATGVYRWAAGRSERVPATVELVALIGTPTLPQPIAVPEAVPTIAPGAWLVFGGGVGRDATFTPVSPSGDGALWGARVEGNVIVPQGARTPDAQHVRDHEIDGQAIRYVGAGALPAGRYAVSLPGDRKVRLVDFGGPQPFASGDRPTSASATGQQQAEEADQPR